jgi:ribosomal protein L11 methyltransferase
MSVTPNPTWLEVSLTVDGEMAEAVAEALARYAPNGVVIESTAIYADAVDEGYPVGPLRVCAYLPVDEELEGTRQRLEESLWYLGRIRPLPDPEFKQVQEINWAEAWKVHYRPVPIGERLIIVPAWLESPDESRVSLKIDPGMAFGTGTHPTTQLCLAALEGQVPAGGAVIDVGCGSGILAIAALKLGAGRAYGVDTDPQAIKTACENAQANGVSEQIKLTIGSVGEIQAGAFPLRQAPLVLANIIAPILLQLLDLGLGDLVAPGGVLILSGILEEQVPEMLAALAAHGLTVIERRQIEDWVALSVTR